MGNEIDTIIEPRAPRKYTPVLSEVIRLRNHLLNHSYIYYHLGHNIVSDHQWQEWADELVIKQRALGEQKPLFYDEAFEGWDGSTGCHLPVDKRIRNIVFKYLLVPRGWKPQDDAIATREYGLWKLNQAPDATYEGISTTRT